jgi:hypothetical protein
MCRVICSRGGRDSAAREAVGCAFVLDDNGVIPGRSRSCGAPLRAGSAYCETHHAICHLPAGSAAEKRQLREIAALAKAVGGKLGRPAAGPPPMLLRRLERIERAFSRPVCS